MGANLHLSLPLFPNKKGAIWPLERSILKFFPPLCRTATSRPFDFYTEWNETSPLEPPCLRRSALVVLYLNHHLYSQNSPNIPPSPKMSTLCRI